MGKVEYLVPRRATKARGLTERVVFALEELGGAAHRDMIAARVNIHLRTGEPRASASLLQQVEQTLRAFERGGQGRRGQALFIRVFGPDTHRWALAARQVGRGDHADFGRVLVAAEG